MSANPEPVVSEKMKELVDGYGQECHSDGYMQVDRDKMPRTRECKTALLREIATLEARQAIPVQVADAISRISGWQPRLYSIQDQPALDAIRTVVEFMVSIPSPQPEPLSMKPESIDTAFNSEPSYSRNAAESLMTTVAGDVVDA